MRKNYLNFESKNREIKNKTQNLEEKNSRFIFL